MRLASELGGVIGRSGKPTCFVVGAGCSLSSGAPSTAAVHQALADATSVRFEGLDLRQALHTLPETEKQDILAPLFADISFSPGYIALASLARRRRILVLNLNWDTALSNACERVGVEYITEDIEDIPGKLPALGDTGLLDIHVHGIIGRQCRYGLIETLSFKESQHKWLLENGLANTTVIIGAEMTYETDFSQLFGEQPYNSRRPAVSQWFFVRGRKARTARIGFVSSTPMHRISPTCSTSR